MADWTAGKGTTALGIIGTALGGLAASGGLGLMGNGYGYGNGCGYGNYGYANGVCSDNTFVSRYEAGLQQKIAEQGSMIALRDANTYNDQKMLELYKYMDKRFGDVEHHIGHQAVVNAQIAANLSCLQNNVAVLNGLTKTVIPIDNVCPEPMQRFNSWVAPAATAATSVDVVGA